MPFSISCEIKYIFPIMFRWQQTHLLIINFLIRSYYLFLYIILLKYNFSSIEQQIPWNNYTLIKHICSILQKLLNLVLHFNQNWEEAKLWGNFLQVSWIKMFNEESCLEQFWTKDRVKEHSLLKSYQRSHIAVQTWEVYL